MHSRTAMRKQNRQYTTEKCIDINVMLFKAECDIGICEYNASLSFLNTESRIAKKHASVGHTRYFWALRPFQIFTGPLFQLNSIY